VSTTDPGALEGIAARTKPAAGWVPAKDLNPEDTTECLPPGDSLVGTRVWAPLREKDPLFEIGTVIAIEHGKVKVRRMSDRTEVAIARGKLYFGTVRPGTKILAMCGGSLKPKDAVIESVREPKFEAQGDPVVKLTCLDDSGKPTEDKRDDQMGSIRTKSEWLPK